MPYKNVTIPDPEQKPRKEWSPPQRRAEILQAIIEAGHPDLISRTEAAKMYGKSQPTITADIKAIAKEIKKELGSDAELITHAVYKKTVKELQSNDKHFLAFKTVMEFNKWLMDTGVKKRAPERIEIEETSVEARLQSAYKALEEMKKRKETALTPETLIPSKQSPSSPSSSSESDQHQSKPKSSST